MPIQADFILRRLYEMAEADPGLRESQPWKAAYERDYAWLGRVIAEHYAGDDTERAELLGGHPRGVRRDQRRRLRGAVGRFLRTDAAPDARPRLPRVRLRADGRAARVTSKANGFANYIASGGGRDFMRPISQEVYGIPRERVIGSASDARLHERTTAAARSRTRPRPTTSTTARRSRSGSGAAPAAGRSSPPATRTATSRCSSSPARGQADAPPARPPRRRRAGVRLHERRRAGPRAGGRGRLDGREHQERLGDGLLGRLWR